MPKYLEIPSDDLTPPNAKEIKVIDSNSSTIGAQSGERSTMPPSAPRDDSPADEQHFPKARRREQGGGQFDGWPTWAKVGATATAITVITGLFIVAFFNMMHQQSAGSALVERLVDKFDKTTSARDALFDRALEKHDERHRQWLVSHGETIKIENEKTRAATMEASSRNEKMLQGVQQSLDKQTLVLKQILDKNGMP